MGLYWLYKSLIHLLFSTSLPLENMGNIYTVTRTDTPWKFEDEITPGTTPKNVGGCPVDGDAPRKVTRSSRGRGRFQRSNEQQLPRARGRTIAIALGLSQSEDGTLSRFCQFAAIEIKRPDGS